MYITNYISIITILIILIFIGVRVYDAIKIGKYTIVVSLITLPIMFGFLLFPTYFLITNLCAPFYSKKYLNSNSKYFLYRIEQEDDLIDYPSVTLQIPIYDEDFNQIIKPLIHNCIKVRDNYPGKCNIIINDDGIFKFLKDNIDDILYNEKVKERIKYYKKYNIGFTARKYKNRAGKFKKASNMNFGNTLSSHHVDICISKQSEQFKILENLVINYIYTYIHYGDIKLGEYILILDSDSSLPDNCLTNIIKVFNKEEKLAYIQHYTIPTENSYQNYFSKFIAEYTTNLYDIIFRISTRNGDIAPLIGHNIILRKLALDNVSINNKYWKEDRVSEDFDLCLRFHTHGYYGKYMLNYEFPFGEGVSLTYQDEIKKYSKFAYGASEIMFNPIKKWYKNLPITQSFIYFLKSKFVPFSSKIGILSYLLTYFSISSGFYSENIKK